VIDIRRFKPNWEKAIGWGVLITLLLSAVFVVIMLVRAPSDPKMLTAGERSKSDYALMLIQCVFGVAAMLLPGLIEHRIKVIIPSRMIIMYTLFLFAAIYLGEVRDFYYEIPHWDTILHTFSGGMLGALGFSIIVLLNKTDRVPINLSPSFIALFTLCFAVTLGVLWEIYEFTCDGFLGLNMQKFALKDGTLLEGRSALADTMKDLIVDTLGAFVISCMGYISLKYKKGWVEGLLLKKRK
jgi:hypothetical protein